MQNLLIPFTLLLFSSSVLSDVDLFFSWKGVVPNMFSDIRSTISIDIKYMEEQLKSNPKIKENKIKSIEHSNAFGVVKIIELNMI